MNWWAGRDSNPQPDRYERPALTIELPAHGARAFGPYTQTGSLGNDVAGLVLKNLLGVPLESTVASVVDIFTAL